MRYTSYVDKRTKALRDGILTLLPRLQSALGYVPKGGLETSQAYRQGFKDGYTAALEAVVKEGL